MPKLSQRLSHPSFSKGFTLIELMVVILILGILTTVAIPSFREFIINQRIKSASFDLMSTIKLARSEAIKRNAQVIITPTNNDWAKGWTVSTNTPTAVTLVQRSSLAGLSITCSPGSSCGSVTYNGDGRSNSGGNQFIQLGSVAIQTSKVTCISVELSGLPKSKKGVC